MSRFWKTLTDRLDALREYRSPREVFMGARIFLFALIAPALWRLGPERVTAILGRNPPMTDPPESEVSGLADLVDTVLWVGRPLLRRGCLVRGSTMFRFLRQAGCEVSLVFGVGEFDGRMRGHCWLRRQGRPYLEAGDRDPQLDYTTTYVIS